MVSKNQQKFISSLSVKKYREEHGYYIVEGVKMVDELLTSGQVVAQLYALPSWLDARRQQLMKRKSLTPQEVTPDELKKISQLSAPNEVLAIARIPETTEITIEIGYYLGLDRINDPGNLGTIIRIASWFGLKGIFCSRDTADCYNSKAVQASMGSLFHVPVVYTDLEQVARTFKSRKMPVYAAVLSGSPLNAQQFTGSGLLLMGSESHGLHEKLVHLADHRITIERKGKAESLNVAVATGIICSRF